LIEQGIAVRAGTSALRKSLFEILKHRTEELSPQMITPIAGLYQNWTHLDERIEPVTNKIEELSRSEANCPRLMGIPGIGPIISTGLVAAIRTGEAFKRGRDFGAWLGLVPCLLFRLRFTRAVDIHPSRKLTSVIVLTLCYFSLYLVLNRNRIDDHLCNFTAACSAILTKLCAQALSVPQRKS
jgi:hypothetical protein